MGERYVRGASRRLFGPTGGRTVAGVVLAVGLAALSSSHSLAGEEEPAHSQAQAEIRDRSLLDPNGQPRWLDTNELIGQYVGGEVPGYAGHYISEDGQSLIVMTTASDRVSVKQLISVQSAISEAHFDKSMLSLDLRLEEAEYEWSDLTHWNQSIREGMDVEESVAAGLVSFGIEVISNRIEVGLRDPSQGSESLLRVVSELGLPAEAIRIVKADEEGPAHHPGSVDAWHSTVHGGLRVRIRAFGDADSTVRPCSAGIVARMDGSVGVISASHCTPTVGGGADGSLIGQNTVQSGSGHGFAREIRDGDLYTGCGPGFLCRRADVAYFARHTDRPLSYGSIVWPTRNNSLHWDGSTRRRINAVNWGAPPAPNQNLAKVGANTGRTEGRVTHSCQDWDYQFPAARVPGSNTGWVRFVCTVNTSIPTAGGDSGAPVFRHDFGGALDATLQGFVMTDQGRYSAMRNVAYRSELGGRGLRVCASSYSC